MLIALTTAWAADCTKPLAETDWVARLDDAEAHFQALEVEDFTEALTLLRDETPCLATGLRPAQAARFHLLRGLDAYNRDDAQAARAHFGSAKAADPTTKLSFDTVPEGHEIHELVAESPVPTGSESMPPPATGALVFDGKRSNERPAERATIAQWLADDGRAQLSGLLVPGEPMLPYEVAPAPTLPDPVPQPAPEAPVARTGWSGGRTALLVTSVAALAGAGVSYGLASAESSRIAGPHDASVTFDDLKSRQGRANTFVTASGILGGIGAGTFVGFVVVR